MMRHPDFVDPARAAIALRILAECESVSPDWHDTWARNLRDAYPDLATMHSRIALLLREA